MSGDFEIFHADCRDFLKSLDDESVDLAILDPPYVTTKEAWDKEDPVNAELVLDLRRVLKPSGSLYVWCGIGEKSQSLIRWFPLFSGPFIFKDLITWKKRRGIGMRKGWLYTREEAMWFVKDNKRFRWNVDAQYGEEPNQFKVGMSGYACKSEFKRITNVWTDIPEPLGKKGVDHYTPKPLEALERIIRAHTVEGDMVIDPFCGSGSTGVSAVRLKRRFRGADTCLEYCESARRRIGDVGESAV